MSVDLFGAAWRPVFLVNVPVGAAAAVLVPRVIPTDRTSGGRRLDLAGLSTASTGVLFVVVPLVLGREWEPAGVDLGQPRRGGGAARRVRADRALGGRTRPRPAAQPGCLPGTRGCAPGWSH